MYLRPSAEWSVRRPLHITSIRSRQRRRRLEAAELGSHVVRTAVPNRLHDRHRMFEKTVAQLLWQPPQVCKRPRGEWGVTDRGSELTLEHARKSRPADSALLCQKHPGRCH